MFLNYDKANECFLTYKPQSLDLKVTAIYYSNVIGFIGCLGVYYFCLLSEFITEEFSV